MMVLSLFETTEQYIFNTSNSLPNKYEFCYPGKKPFENFVGKSENAGNQHFLLFPQCFLPFFIDNFHTLSRISSAICKCFEFGPI